MEKNKKSGLGIALSGGGSRAIAFHFGVIEALHELKIDRKIKVVSAISGGAVIAALWVNYFRDWNKFSNLVQLVLDEGLEIGLKEKILAPKTFWKSILNRGIDVDIFSLLLDKRYFNGMKLSNLPEEPGLILNAAELKTGTNFKFNRDICGSYKAGKCSTDILLSMAVACSAAYPLFFLPKKLRNNEEKFVYLTDGGAYDCLGANALLPDKEDNISILRQSLETIIISDASAPFSTDELTIDKSVFRGLYASYLTSANRNRSLLYNKLYHLNQSKEIPYLGTIKMDSSHPDLKLGWSQDDLDIVNNYRTDFKPVKGKAFELLKQKGKESAIFIINNHLPHLLN